MIVYGKDADKDRAFPRDVLKFPSVDAGRGWLIFALAPAEVAVHPPERNGKHELYFMRRPGRTIADLTGRGVRCSKVEHAGWGSMTSSHSPAAGKVGVCHPRQLVPRFARPRHR